MKFNLLIILVLVFANSTEAQTRAKKSVGKQTHKKLTAKEEQLQHKASDDYCVFTNKYTAQQRLKFYPFFKTTKILAVSYDSPGSGEIRNDSASIAKALKVGLQVKDGILNYATLHEVQELNAQQIDSLTNLMFNTDFRKSSNFNIQDLGKCFEPRNAFVFFDADGKVFDYLEVCFECRQSYSKTEKIGVGIGCTQKYDLLKKYMFGLGIKFGTGE